MTKPEVIQKMQPDKILACIDGLDPWTIYKPSSFVEKGLPEEAVSLFARRYKSDGSAKGSITDLETGEIVDEMEGIYALDFVQDVAWTFGITSDKMGRGFRARDLSQQIREHFEVEEK